MNSKRMNDPQAARERAVYDYLLSLESGDIDGIIDALQQATYDAPLDQMLVDAHHAYFEDEQNQQSTLADADTHEMAVLEEPATLSSHGTHPRQERRARRPWLQALVAVLLIGLLVSSFLTLVALRRSGTSSPGTPTVTPSCQSYPFKQFDSQNHVTTATSLNALTAVTVVSASDAWAVGSSYSALPGSPERSSTFIEHWDGQSWQIVPSPNSTNSNNVLVAVAAVSSSDVWAAGYSIHGTTAQGSESSLGLRTLIEHWDGKQWHVVPSPNGPDGKGTLNALAAISAHDIWAAGSFPDTKSGLFHPLLEHWDGTGWRIVSLEGSSTTTGTVGFFKAMSALASNDVWAVGTGRNANEQQVHGLIEHWNGSRWTPLPAPSNSSLLQGVSALPAHHLWVTGNNDTNGNTLIAQWDGQRWSSTALPASLAKQETNLSGLSAISSENIWAVGSVLGNDQINRLLILNWNGKAWHQISSPALQESSNLPNSSASGIALYGQSRVWIVGNQRDSDGGLSSALILGQSTCP